MQPMKGTDVSTRLWTEGEVESDEETFPTTTNINPVLHNVIVSKKSLEPETICHVCYMPLLVSIMSTHLVQYHDFLNNPASTNIFAKHGIDVMKHSFSANVFQVIQCERVIKKRLVRLLESQQEEPDLQILEVPQFMMNRKRITDHMAYRRKMDMIKLHHGLVNIAMSQKSVEAAIDLIQKHFEEVRERESRPNVEADIAKLRLKDEHLKNIFIPEIHQHNSEVSATS